MADKQSTTAFILNPLARDGKSMELWPPMEALLNKYKIAFEKFDLVPGDDVVATTKTIVQQNFGRIVAGGGDGTQNAVINGIMQAEVETRPEYAVLPLGTGNSIAKSFDLDFANWDVETLDTYVRILLAGTRYNLDLGLVNEERYFADSFSVGFDAVVLKDRNATRHSRKVMRNGIESYVPSVLKNFIGQYKRPAARITVDDQILTEKLFNLVIKDCRVYAGNFVLSEKIRANDGLLDAFLYATAEAYTSEIGTHALKKLLELDATGLSTDLVDLAVRNSEHRQGKTIQIDLGNDTPSQIDGEEYKTLNHYNVECIPHALVTIVRYER